MIGELKKLKIEAYKDIDCTEKTDVFEVMFNPSDFSQKYEVEYDEGQGQGSTGSTQKLGKIKPQEYTFAFLFDGTGATGEKKDVSKEIERFLTVAGKMSGEIHRPFYLKIWWGGLISKCVLKSADITYTLFQPDGYPLRAKVNATFSECIADTLRTRKEGKSSPDLSHYRTVSEGDTLPLMCYKMYGDSSYYRDVARYNNLVNFRKLEVGALVQFPPLKSKTLL